MLPWLLGWGLILLECVERVIHFGVPRTMEVLSKKLEGMGSLLSQPFTLTLHSDTGCKMYIEEMQPIMKDYCKNIIQNTQGKNCAKPLWSNQKKHGCCDICVNGYQCSECVDLPRCLAMEEICIIESQLLFLACFQFLTTISLCTTAHSPQRKKKKIGKERRSSPIFFPSG